MSGMDPGDCGGFGMDHGHRSFLVVEDDDVVARNLTQILRTFGTTIVAATGAAALRALATRARWSALLIDVGLPDASGLDILEGARLLHPRTPALVLTRDAEASCINRAYDLGAHYLVKPVSACRVAAFLEQAVAAQDHTTAVALAYATRYELSDAEHDILLRAVRGEGRDAIAAARGSSPNTVKKQVVTLLQKTGDDSLQGAVAPLLREVAGV